MVVRVFGLAVILQLVAVEVVLGIPYIHGPSLAEDFAVITVGELVILQCDNENKSSIHWNKGSIIDQSIQPISPRHAAIDNQLLLLNYALADNGQYTCSSQYSTQKVLYSCPLQVTAAKLISEFLEEPEDTIALSEMTVVLRCSVDPPTSIVHWEKDGEKVDDTMDVVDGNLLISPATEEDSGDYRCVATNDISRDVSYSRTARLNVTGVACNESDMIEFIVKPSDVVAVKGDTVRMWCVVNTGEAPTWERVGNDSLPLSAKVLPTDVLVLEEVGVDDEGVYRCSVGDTSVDAMLSVGVPPSVTINIGEDIEAILGSTVTITCMTEVQSNVTWQIGGAVVHQESDTSVSSHLLELTRSYIRDDDNVVWVQCLASNEYGCNTSALAITVIEVHVLSVNPKQLFLKKGESDNLHCVVNTSNFVFMTWSIGTTILETSFSPSLTLQVSAAGEYTCTAHTFENEFSETVVVSVKYEELNINVSPDTVVVMENDAMELTCTASGGSNSYMMLWSHDHTGDYTTVLRGTLSTLHVSSVSADHHGTFKCTVVDTVTSTILSHSSNVIVKPSLPNAPPTTIITRWYNATTIAVIWSPSPNSLLGYKLAWGSEREHVPHIALAAVSPTTYSYLITKLDSEQIYKVLVWPYSLGGDGPYISSTVQDYIEIVTPPTRTTPAPYSTVTLTCAGISTTDAIVELRAFTNNIARYLMRYSCQNGDVQQEGTYLIEPVNTSIDKTVLLHRLVPGCDYTTNVLAYTDENQFFSQSDSCHFETYDNEFISFNITWDDNGGVVLSWLLPSDLQRYSENIVVELRLEGEEEWVPVQRGDTISGLEELDRFNDHQYSVRVTYSNDIIIYNTTLVLLGQAALSDVGVASDVWLTYGVGIGALLLACLLLLLLILILKHVQTSRRENDKVTNHREKNFEKLNQRRSIRLSVKKTTTKI